MGDADKVTMFNLNCTGPGSTPQEPLALVVKISDSKRSALESRGRGGLSSAAEPDTVPPEIRYRTSISHSIYLLLFFLTIWGEVYYLLYGNDCEIPSRVAIDPGKPSLGRIRADSVPPPHSPASIKRCISRVERNPKLTHSDLFADISCDAPLKEGHISNLPTDGPGLSPNEPMAIVQMEISGSTSQEPLALVVKISDSKRSALESRGRGGLLSAAEPDTVPPEIRYRTSISHSPTFIFLTIWGEVYYLLYGNDCEMPSRVAIDPGKPSLGRIRADSVPPPHSPASIKRCISRVERNPKLALSDLFADLSCDTPLKEGHISNLLTDGPGLSPNEPMAMVQVEVPDGRYIIKSRAAYQNSSTRSHVSWSWQHKMIGGLQFKFQYITPSTNYYVEVSRSPII